MGNAVGGRCVVGVYGVVITFRDGLDMNRVVWSLILRTGYTYRTSFSFPAFRYDFN